MDRKKCEFCGKILPLEREGKNAKYCSTRHQTDAATKRRRDKRNEARALTNITEKEFNAFVKVQKSSVTNMLDIQKVSGLTGLSEFAILSIIKNYGKLNQKFIGANNV